MASIKIARNKPDVVVPNPYVVVGDKRFPYTALANFCGELQPEVLAPVLAEVETGLPIASFTLVPKSRALQSLFATAYNDYVSSSISASHLMLISRPTIKLPAGPFHVYVPASRGWYDAEFAPTRVSGHAIVGVLDTGNGYNRNVLPPDLKAFVELVAWFFDKNSLRLTLDIVHDRIREQTDCDYKDLLHRWLFTYIATPMPRDALMAFACDPDPQLFEQDIRAAEEQVADFAGLRQSLQANDFGPEVQRLTKNDELGDLCAAGLVGRHVLRALQKSPMPQNDAATIVESIQLGCQRLGL